MKGGKQVENNVVLLFLPLASPLSEMRHCARIGCYFCLLTLLVLIFSGFLRSDINVQANGN